MKKLFNYFNQGTPEYILLHAKYRKSRGRRPVAITAIQHNPAKALKEAQAVIDSGEAVMVRPAKSCSANTIMSAIKQIGLRGMNINEVLSLQNSDFLPKEDFWSDSVNYASCLIP